MTTVGTPCLQTSTRINSPYGLVTMFLPSLSFLFYGPQRLGVYRIPCCWTTFRGAQMDSCSNLVCCLFVRIQLGRSPYPGRDFHSKRLIIRCITACSNPLVLFLRFCRPRATMAVRFPTAMLISPSELLARIHLQSSPGRIPLYRSIC